MDLIRTDHKKFLPATVEHKVEQAGERKQDLEIKNHTVHVGHYYMDRANDTHYRAKLLYVIGVKDNGFYQRGNGEQAKNDDSVLFYEMQDWKGEVWHDEPESMSIKYFKRCLHMGDDINKYFKESEQFRKGEIDMSHFPNPADGFGEMSGMEVMGAVNKEVMVKLQNEIEAAKLELERVQAFMKMELDRKKAEVEARKEQMLAMLNQFKKILKKVHRVIDTIELYLGVHEDIVQIQEGQAADVETPISFRQRVLFMDEELALHQFDADGGDIEVFDNWLLEEARYKTFIPEEKGIVVFRPRRYEKDYGYYGKESWINGIINQMKGNWKTYFLIRNGENIYRVWGAINVMPRLFPKRDELQQMVDRLEKYHDRDDFDEHKHGYERRAFVMQGLIDRTQIFHPLPMEIKLFDLAGDAAKYVNFIYDDEDVLSDGRLRFWSWVKKINSTIKKGSRVLNSGKYDDGWNKKEWTDRLFYYVTEWNAPQLPAPGIYEVNLKKEKRRCKKENYDELVKHYNIKRPRWDISSDNDLFYEDYVHEQMYILHNPGDTVHGGWGNYNREGHTRKKRIGFIIWEDDNFIFNYDRISLDDIEFYLSSGLDRSSYYKMIPWLLQCREHLLKETEREKEFVQFIIREFKKETGAKCSPEFVYEYVDWWKKKVTFTRPITKDDAKAYRMIMKKMKKDLSF